jgi:thiosulfate/3-mercaptopyruvate sulfurtransferase
MSEARSPFVVAPEWLAARLGGSVKIVDASWFFPAAGRNARAEYEAGHIPGAVFFDQDEVVDPDSPLPHTLPSPEVFAEHAGRLGLSEDDTIVVYDSLGIYTAPRVWWMLATMGAKDVYVLDGGFDNWKAAGLPVTAEPTLAEPAVFTPHFDAAAVASLEDMKRFVETGASQIADARSPGRFTGEEPEPRAGVRPGHMPGARSVTTFSLSENGRLKDLEALRRTFADAGIDLGRPIATSCGSGVTAAVITLALRSLGHEQNTLYDGSWSEWGARSDTPVETGAAKAR